MALSFADSVKANCQRMLAEVDKKCQHIAFSLFTEIVIETPVDKGLLCNNWFPGTGADFSTEITSYKDTTGSGSKSRIYAMLGKGTFLGKDGSMTLANNLDYAYRAEVLGWPSPEWSGKVGPYAMVGKSLIKIASDYK